MQKLRDYFDPRVPSGLTTYWYALVFGVFAVLSLGGAVSFDGNLGGLVSGSPIIHRPPAPNAIRCPHVALPYGNLANGCSYVPSQAPTVKAPKSPAIHPHVSPDVVAQVGAIYTKDTHVNIGPTINAVAAYYGFSAPGYAALVGTESGFYQYAPHYPIAGAGYCDYSAGLVQITTCTAGALGIGDGSMSSSNIGYVFWYEQADPVRELWLGGKLLSEFQAATCADFTVLYPVWNMGQGYGHPCNQGGTSSVYRYPSGMAYSNYLNYLGWWNFVWNNYAYTPAPPTPRPTPTPFNWSLWNHWRLAHHKHVIKPYLNGRLTWAASAWYNGNTWLGGIAHKDVFYPRNAIRTHSFSKTEFAHGCVIQWNDFHRAKTAHHPC